MPFSCKGLPGGHDAGFNGRLGNTRGCMGFMARTKGLGAQRHVDGPCRKAVISAWSASVGELARYDEMGMRYCMYAWNE